MTKERQVNLDSERNRAVAAMRATGQYTMGDIANEFEISRQRVHQILDAYGLTGKNGRSITKLDFSPLKTREWWWRHFHKTNRQIAKETGMNPGTVGSLRNEAGFTTYAKWLAERGLQRCNGPCHVVKAYEDYPKNRSNPSGYGRVCLICNAQKMTNYYARKVGYRYKIPPRVDQVRSKRPENSEWPGKEAEPS